MLLHSGAGLHGHEYSLGKRLQRPPLRRSSFYESVKLAPILDSAAETSIRESSIVSFATAHESQIPEPFLQADRGGGLGGIHVDGSSHYAAGIDPNDHERQEEDHSSDDEQTHQRSDAASSYTERSMRQRMDGYGRKIAATSYAFAHPAPLKLQQKLLHFRPKLLFQLQRIDARPVPQIDVLAASVVVPRLMKNFSRMLPGRGTLGPKDVMLFKSDNYASRMASVVGGASVEEELGSREAIAVICEVRNEPTKAEICFSNGSVWHASVNSKNRFEFTKEDDETGEITTARWVPRRKSKRLSAITIKSANSSITDQTSVSKLIFSVMRQGQRQHPVMASLSRKALDIRDFYKTVGSSHGGRDSDSIAASGSNFSNDQEREEEEEEEEKGTWRIMENEIKILVQTTSVWVALRLGWCPNFKYDATGNTDKSRAEAFGCESPLCSSFTSDTFQRIGTPDIIQRSIGSLRGRRPASTAGSLRNSPPSLSPVAGLARSASRSRAISSGTAFLLARAQPRKVADPTQDTNPVASPGVLNNSNHDLNGGPEAIRLDRARSASIERQRTSRRIRAVFRMSGNPDKTLIEGVRNPARDEGRKTAEESPGRLSPAGTKKRRRSWKDCLVLFIKRRTPKEARANL